MACSLTYALSFLQVNLASRYLECQSSTSLFGDKEDPVAGLVEVTNLGAEISGGVPRGVAANGGAMAAKKIETSNCL